MSYATQRPRPAPRGGRTGAAYQKATTVVKGRAHNGEPCYFWGRDPQCPGPHFNWALPHNHRDAFTAHHLHRIMDGGQAIPDPAFMAPAHRGCNARDGLRAQNARRQGHQPTTNIDVTERTSRAW